MTTPDALKVASLTDAQRRYLSLVAEGLTSKQIAQLVGGSHHTVNVEIGVAMRILGAASRRDAASMLTDAPPARSYEPSYDAPAVAPIDPGAQTAPRHEPAVGDHRWALPIATGARPINVMSAGRRAGWILVIAAALTLLLGGLVSGVTTLLTSLDRLI